MLSKFKAPLQSLNFRALFTVLAVIATCSTLYDVRSHAVQSQKRSQLLLSFSIYSNIQKLFSLKSSSSDISCIHGIRALSLIIIVFFHSFFFRIQSSLISEENARNFVHLKFAAFLTTLPIFVESFFVMSGALFTISMLKDLKRFFFLIFQLISNNYWINSQRKIQFHFIGDQKIHAAHANNSYCHYLKQHFGFIFGAKSLG